MYRLLTASIGIVAVALLVFGCGDSGEAGEAEATVEVLTKSQFVKQADQACAKLLEEREAAAEAWRKDHSGNVSGEEVDEAFKEVIAPAVEKQAEALQALNPPEADSAEISRMLDNLVKAKEGFEKEGAKGAEEPEVSQFETEARKYGLKICTRLYN